MGVYMHIIGVHVHIIGAPTKFVSDVPKCVHVEGEPKLPSVLFAFFTDIKGLLQHFTGSL